MRSGVYHACSSNTSECYLTTCYSKQFIQFFSCHLHHSHIATFNFIAEKEPRVMQLVNDMDGICAQTFCPQSPSLLLSETSGIRNKSIWP